MHRLFVVIIAVLTAAFAVSLTVAQESTPGAEPMPCPEADADAMADADGSPMASPMGSPTASPVSGTASPVSSPAAGAVSCTVEIRDNRFVPETIEIAVGTTVTWTNTGSDIHTVHAKDGSFKSSDTPLGPGDTFTHEFTTPGEFGYDCLVHFPDMSGTVIVK
jgi:plastocyanin